MSTLAVLGVVVVLYALVSKRLDGTPVTAPMVFVAAGLVAGAAGLVPGVSVEGENRLAVAEAARHVAEIALVLLLFAGAARIPLRTLRGASSLPARLLVIALPLSIGLGGLVALGLFRGELDVWEALLVGAILAPTDAALGAAVVSSPKLPLRLRETLDVEAGLNDGLTVPFFTVFAALAAEAALGEADFLVVAAEKLGYGILVGAGLGLAGGVLVSTASRRGWMTGSHRQFAVLAVAVLAWWTAEEAGGSGLIAAFVGGGAFGAVARAAGSPLLELAQDLGELLSLLVFFAFGAVAFELLGSAGWEVTAYAVVSLTAVRMLPVAFSLVGTDLRPLTVAYLGWFGPRGLASVLLALILVVESPGLPGTGTIAVVVAATVLASVFAHGATAAPLTNRFARTVEEGSA